MPRGSDDEDSSDSSISDHKPPKKKIKVKDTDTPTVEAPKQDVKDLTPKPAPKPLTFKQPEWKSSFTKPTPEFKVKDSNPGPIIEKKHAVVLDVANIACSYGNGQFLLRGYIMARMFSAICCG